MFLKKMRQSQKNASCGNMWKPAKKMSFPTRWEKLASSRPEQLPCGLRRLLVRHRTSKKKRQDLIVILSPVMLLGPVLVHQRDHIIHRTLPQKPHRTNVQNKGTETMRAGQRESPQPAAKLAREKSLWPFQTCEISCCLFTSEARIQRTSW